MRRLISSVFTVFMDLVCGWSLKKNSGKLIGRAGLEYREPCREGEAELGYLITPEHWRKGYATEVCQAILSYAKDELGMERIISHVDERNLASRQFLGKGISGKTNAGRMDLFL